MSMLNKVMCLFSINAITLNDSFSFFFTFRNYLIKLEDKYAAQDLLISKFLMTISM